MTVLREVAPDTLSAAAFLTWNEARPGPGRFELLDGLCVAMAAERLVHARIKGDIYAAFRNGVQAAALPCETFGDGMAVRVDDENVFEPDVLVRCGSALANQAIVVEDPIIVVEVGSPSKRRLDALTKLARYFRNPHIVHYLIVVPDGRIVIHHRRADDGDIRTTSHEAGTLRLDPPGLDLAFADIFASADAAGRGDSDD